MWDARRVPLHAGARALPEFRSLGSTRALACRCRRPRRLPPLRDRYFRCVCPDRGVACYCTLLHFAFLSLNCTQLAPSKTGFRQRLARRSPFHRKQRRPFVGFLAVFSGMNHDRGCRDASLGMPCKAPCFSQLAPVGTNVAGL